MDIALSFSEKYFFTPYVYPKEFLPEDSILRQFVSLYILVTIGGYLLYFFAAGLSFIFVFDKRLMSHPLFLEVINQYKYHSKTIQKQSFFILLEITESNHERNQSSLFFDSYNEFFICRMLLVRSQRAFKALRFD